MKNALKIALPTVLAIVLGWLAIEGVKFAKAKINAERAAKALRQQQAAAAAAAAAETVE